MGYNFIFLLFFFYFSSQKEFEIFLNCSKCKVIGKFGIYLGSERLIFIFYFLYFTELTTIKGRLVNFCCLIYLKLRQDYLQFIFLSLVEIFLSRFYIIQNAHFIFLFYQLYRVDYFIFYWKSFINFTCFQIFIYGHLRMFTLIIAYQYSPETCLNLIHFYLFLLYLTCLMLVN